MASRPRRSLILATISLHRMAGGLEKNIILLANAMAERGYRVGIVTFDRPDATAFFPIDSRVEWTKAGETPAHGKVTFRERLRIIGRCRQAIRKFGQGATLVCFHHGILVRFLLAALFLDARVICSERNSLTHYDFIRARKWNLNFLALFLVKRIVVQFPSYIADYPRLLRRKIAAIANPVAPARVQARPGTPAENGRYILISAARFSHQKNIDILVRAFAGLASRHARWDLCVVGDGERRAEIEQLVADHGLGERVILPGNASDVEPWLARSHLFCLPSKWEGFPNALAEAMAHGLPAVGYAGCAGVRDLITSGVNGLLADGNGDVGTLRDALDALMADDALRAEMGAAATRSMSAYAPDAIFARWDGLLQQC